MKCKFSYLLYKACKHGDLDILRHLAQASTKYSRCDYWSAEYRSLSPLENAFENLVPQSKLFLTVADILLKNGADPNRIFKNGLTALHLAIDMAIVMQTFELIKLLLQYGASSTLRAKDCGAIQAHDKKPMGKRTAFDLALALKRYYRLRSKENYLVYKNVVQLLVNNELQTTDYKQSTKFCEDTVFTSYFFSRKIIRLWKNMLDYSAFSDVEILFVGKKLKAHCCILSASSPIFEAFFLGHKGKKQFQIMCPHVSWQVMKFALRFIYQGVFRNFKKEETDYALNLLTFCDQYKITQLLPVIEKEVISLIDIDSLGTIYKVSSQLSSDLVTRRCVDFCVKSCVEINKSLIQRICESDIDLVVGIIKAIP